MTDFFARLVEKAQGGTPIVVPPGLPMYGKTGSWSSGIFPHLNPYSDPGEALEEETMGNFESRKPRVAGQPNNRANLEVSQVNPTAEGKIPCSRYGPDSQLPDTKPASDSSKMDERSGGVSNQPQRRKMESEDASDPLGDSEWRGNEREKVTQCRQGTESKIFPRLGSQEKLNAFNAQEEMDIRLRPTQTMNQGLAKEPQLSKRTQRERGHMTSPKPATLATVKVTIGRIDVRAINPTPQATAVANPPRQAKPPSLSLADYLKQRNEGKLE